MTEGSSVVDAARSEVGAEDLFRLIVEGQPTATLVLGRDRTIALVNREAEALFGYGRAELIGRAVEMLIPARFQGDHPEHVERFLREPRARPMGLGRELFGRRKDGREVPIEIGLNPIETSQGSFTVASVIDITERKRAEERFRLVVEAAPNAIIVTDRNGTITLANPKAEDLFGFSQAELVGRKIDTLVPPRYRGSHPAHVRGFFSDPRARAMGAGRDLRALRKDGSEFPVEVGLNPFESPDGRLVMTSIIDITERKRADAAVLRSEERFRVMVEGVTDHSILMLDPRGHVADWNAGARRMMGYDANEIVGRHFSCFYLDEDLANAGAALQRAAALGHREDEVWQKRRDGGRFWAHIVLTAMRDDGGALQGFSKMTRDLTQKRHADERFRQVVEASPTGMIMVGNDGKILLVNTQVEKLFGYSRLELVGQPVERLIPERFRHRHRVQRSGFFDAPTARPLSARGGLRGVRKDGGEFDVEIGLSPIEVMGGTAVMASVIDITERKVAEDELRRSNAELEQFAYIASHDLQEPLRMVASYTELLGERYRGRLDERADKYIHYAVDGAKRMQRLVSDLLAFSRVGSQGKPLSTVSSESVLHDVLHTLAPAIRDSGAVIECGVLPPVLADEDQLRQLLQNILGNAVKFRGDAPPRVRVGASRNEAGHWVFAVSDNGIGIEMQYAERIFQMFQRLHERGKFDGSGIGLTIAKKIVERHGGRIWFESTPGVGSTFFFTLMAAPGVDS